MALNLNGYSFALFFNALVTLLLGFYIFRKRNNRGSYFYGLILVAVSLWSVCKAVELMNRDVDINILFYKISILAVATIPPLWFLFSLRYAQKYHLLSSFIQWSIWVFPAIYVLLAFTNDKHGLIWQNVKVIDTSLGQVVDYEQGWGVYLFSAYSIFLFIIGTYYLINRAIRLPRLYQAQTYVIVLMIALPSVFNILYLTGKSPIEGFDLTPFGFGIAGFLSVFGVFSLKMLDLSPVARDILFQDMSDGVIVIDKKERVVDANPAASAFLDKHNLISENIKDYIPEWPSKTDRLPLDATTHIEITINRPKKQVWFDLAISPLLDDRNQKNGRLIVMRNISDRKEAEAVLIKSESKLKELNLTKDKFFSILAHDIKAPFQTILGFSELLDDEFDDYSDEEKKLFIRNIREAASGTFKLMENLLDWSRMQRGRIDFEPENIVLVKAIDETISLLRVTAEKKMISLETSIEPTVMLFADLNMFKTILRNLVSNALKFTHPGGRVMVYTNKHPKYQYPGMVTLSVSDTGVGIPEGSIEEIFRFDQKIQTEGTAQEKGTGLGLILCKEFVNRNHGKIWLESTVGKGSVFHFSLPKAK